MTQRELSQLYYLSREIEMDKERLIMLRDKSKSITAGSSELPFEGGSDNKIERYVAEIIDLEALISAKLKRCMRERNRLEKYIDKIPDSLTRQIFQLRFINGLSWTQVANHLGGGNSEEAVKKRCYRAIHKK